MRKVRKTALLVENPTLLHTTVPNVIKIRSNVQLPAPKHLVLSKYGFISTLEVGESFEITTTTHDFKPKSLAPAAYQIASTVRKTVDRDFTIACRTLEGTSVNPTKVGCWRIA